MPHCEISRVVERSGREVREGREVGQWVNGGRRGLPRVTCLSDERLFWAHIDELVEAHSVNIRIASTALALSSSLHHIDAHDGSLRS